MSLPSARRALRPLLPALVCVVLAASAAPLHAQAVVTDDFGIFHDYLASGAGGTLWDGLLKNSGTAATQNASVTRVEVDEGLLTMTSSEGNWEASADDGLLLFMLVDGDFVAETEVFFGSVVNFNDLGLMARVATSGSDDTAAGPGEDYVALRYFAGLGFNSIRSTNGGSSANTDASGLQKLLQLERHGIDFHFRRRAAAADPWVELPGSPVRRPDLAGLPLQIGLWQATFGSNSGSAAFESFRLDVTRFFSDGFETGTFAGWTSATAG